MKEVPILFSGEMVRAILAGRKTQTRRIVEPKKIPIVEEVLKVNGKWVFDTVTYDLRNIPKAAPGDTFWCRETFLTRGNLTIPVYRADMSDFDAAGFGGMYGGWKPSIFMPRKFSRIDLRVTDVRIERLQDICEEDAEAEGADFWFNELHPNHPEPPSSSSAYRMLWESINGKGSWSRNPWVWCYSFEKIKP
jgi:hypothetical protein